MDCTPYLEYARRVARRHRPYGILDIEDLEAVAMVATWRACESFDPARGVLIYTWIHRNVTGAIQHAYRDASGVPGHVYSRGERFPPVVSLDALTLTPDGGYSALVDSFVDPRETPEGIVVGCDYVEWLMRPLRRYQRAVIERAMTGETREETAASLGYAPLSVGSIRTMARSTVRARMERAKEALT